MLAGSVTMTAYLVMGATMGVMSSSWSPSWRRGRPKERTRVSRFTWPETTMSPRESVQAPCTPVMALLPPGPEVTFTAASRPVSRK